jgi:hypothetical protein
MAAQRKANVKADFSRSTAFSALRSLPLGRLSTVPDYCFTWIKSRVRVVRVVGLGP